MSDPIKFLQKHKIPTESAVKAIKYMNHHSEELNFKTLLVDMTGHSQEYSDRDTKYTFMYAVQEVLYASNTTNVFNMEDIVKTAHTKAINFIKNNPWTFAAPDQSSTPSSVSGKPKRKKGAKQTAALEIYGRLKDTKTKQEIIQIFIDDLDMSKSGATTYFYNVKKKLGT